MANPFTHTRLERYKLAHEYSPNARFRELLAIETFLSEPHLGTVLEIGSGTGFLTNWLLKRSTIVDTVDISAEVIKGVRKHFQTELKDRLPTALPSKSYDLVISLASFHHIINKPEALPFDLLIDLDSILKPGGKLLIIDVPSTYDVWAFSNKTEQFSYELTSYFFTKVVDRFSKPCHNGTYLNSIAITKQINNNLGWQLINRELLYSPWEFTNEEEAYNFLITLFNLVDVQTSEDFQNYLRKAIFKTKNGVALRWLLCTFCLQKHVSKPAIFKAEKIP